MGRNAGTSIIVAGLVCACAGLSPQRPLELPADALYDRNIVVVRQPAPPLQADAIDGDLSIADRFADPAAGIGRGLAIRLATERGMIVLSTGTEAAGVADAAALAAAHPGADYVLDVQTLDWHLDNYLSARDRYRLNYAAQLRLIDRQGEVVAAAQCRSEQGDIDNPPSREDLLAQDGALVRGYLELATSRCIEHAAGTMLGLRAESQLQTARTRGQPIRVPPAGAGVPAQPPVATGPMPSVHDFFDDSLAPTQIPTQTSPVLAPSPLPTVAPRPTPRPTPMIAAAPLSTHSPTPTPTKPPRASPVPAPAPSADAVSERVAAAPVPMPIPRATAPAPTPLPAPAPAPAEDDLMPGDRLTPAARASGQVVELLADTPFRDSPRLGTRISRTLPAGTEVVVRQRIYNAEGEWWFIIIPGDIGWMRSPDPIPYGSPRAGTDTRADPR